MRLLFSRILGLWLSLALSVSGSNAQQIEFNSSDQTLYPGTWLHYGGNSWGSYFLPISNTGISQYWDFSTFLQPFQPSNFLATQVFLPTDVIGIDSSFLSADFGFETISVNWFRINSNELLLLGNQGPSANSPHVTFDPPLQMMEFPFTENQTNLSVPVDYEVVNHSGLVVRRSTGTVNRKIVGTGTVKLPGGAELDSTICLEMEFITQDSSISSDSSLVYKGTRVEIYQWFYSMGWEGPTALMFQRTEIDTLGILDLRELFYARNTQTVGFAEHNDAELTLFPNPIDHSTVLTGLSNKGNLRLDILDASGRLCASEMVHSSSDQISISKGDLSPGHYMLRITPESGHLEVLRFVVE